MNLEPNCFFRTYVKHCGQPINTAQLKFKYVNISYEQFTNMFCDSILHAEKNSDWYNQSPSWEKDKLLESFYFNPFPVVVEAVAHLARGIFWSSYSTFRLDFRPLSCTVFYLIRDCQEILGRIMTLYDAIYGSYLVEESRFHKTCYDQFMKETCISPSQPQPQSAAEQRKFAFWLGFAERYYDLGEYEKAFKVICFQNYVLEYEEKDDGALVPFAEKLADRIFKTENYKLAVDVARKFEFYDFLLDKVVKHFIAKHKFQEAADALDKLEIWREGPLLDKLTEAYVSLAFEVSSSAGRSYILPLIRKRLQIKIYSADERDGVFINNKFYYYSRQHFAEVHDIVRHLLPIQFMGIWIITRCTQGISSHLRRASTDI